MSEGSQDWGKFMLKAGVKFDTRNQEIAMLVRTPVGSYDETFVPWLIRRVRDTATQVLITNVVELWENISAGKKKKKHI